MSETTAVAPRRVLDLESAKANQKFLDAYTAGKLDKLTADQQGILLMALGEKLGVKPELGELMIYQGKPYLTLAGYRRIAHQTGLLAGLQPRPATQLERRQFDASEEESVWVCDVFKKGAGRHFRGWGAAGGRNDRNPVSKQYPREMAKKRAVYDGLRLAFPPAEIIGDLHLKYIAEAEEEIERTRVGNGRHVSTLGYDADIDEAEIETPADVLGDVAEAPVQEQGETKAEPTDAELAAEDARLAEQELPLGDKPRRNHNAITEGL